MRQSVLWKVGGALLFILGLYGLLNTYSALLDVGKYSGLISETDIIIVSLAALASYTMSSVFLLMGLIYYLYGNAIGKCESLAKLIKKEEGEE